MSGTNEPCQWAYSSNEEDFTGLFASPEEAAAVGFDEDEDATRLWIGRAVPYEPETHLHGEDVIDMITRDSEEELLQDAAYGWPHASRDKVADLTQRLRDAFVAWMDAHGLRPRFFSVDDVRQVTRPEEAAQ